MSKTDLTVKLEHEIWRATKKQGVFGCFEVTIGWFGSERVDYMTYDTKGIFRCYEIKVSKSDFYSKAKKTFVGHFNYFVMPRELFEEVKTDIPSHIGVYVSGMSVKRARKQKMIIDVNILKDSMIRSLSREFEKQYDSGIPSKMEHMNRVINRLNRERDDYKKRYFDLMDVGRKKYGHRWYVDD